jgi:DNA primase
MGKRYSKKMLRKLRNEVPINILISDILKLPNKISEGYFRFLCPRCSEFNTATNPKTNLARCFRCQQNLNPIDMVMIVKRVNFKEAVQYLSEIAPAEQENVKRVQRLALNLFDPV